MKTKQMFVGLGVVAALGAAIVPMASYAVTDKDSGDVTVSLKVGSTISMALNSDTISDEVLTSESSNAKSTVATISTNSASGYTLSATPNPASGALTGTDANNVISYVGTNYNSAAEGWALSVGGTFKNLTGGEIPLFTGSGVADSVDTTVVYNFKTDADTVPDTYSATLTYTASVI